MLSQMQLRDFVVQLLHIEANPDFRPQKTKESTSRLYVDFDFLKKRNAEEFRVNLEVKVNSAEGDFKKNAYRIHVVVFALYEFDKAMSKEEIDNMLPPNGLAMAYSIARGIVAQATGTSMHERFMLPTVNFIELLKKKAVEGTKKPVHSRLEIVKGERKRISAK